MLPKDTKRPHFVGIGGCGMSGIALVLQQSGFEVSGSDLSDNRMTRRLRDAGARVYQGHHPDHVRDCDALVVSTAIRQDNPELIAARYMGVPVVHRADALDHILRGGISVACSGTHGKTTTTSMMATACELSGIDVTALIGGELPLIDGNAKRGYSGVVVAEADESDGSFLKYNPDYAIVTNIDDDHLDTYGSTKAVERSFEKFIGQVKPAGAAAVCVDDLKIAGMLRRLDTRALTYSVADPDADFYAGEIVSNGQGVSYTLHIRGKRQFRVQLGVHGVFNAANSLGVLAICAELGAPLESAADALAGYRGAKRRFQIKGEHNGVTVVDDYAHHPTEVVATLGSARSYQEVRDGGRVVGVFQPHRYSRTMLLGRQFGPTFNDAQEVIVTEVYAAGEEPITGVNGQMVYESIVASGHPNVRYIPEKSEIVDYLHGASETGDLVMTLGAGDIWQVGEGLLDRWRSNETVSA